MINYDVQKTISNRLNVGWIEIKNSSDRIILFLHGFPDDPSIWEPQFEYFKEKFHIIAPYARGMGPSDSTNDMNRFAEKSVLFDHLKILDAVDPKKKKKITIIGHDLGTVHAFTLAKHLEGRVEKLVLMGGLPLPIMVRRFSDPEQMFRAWYIGMFQIPAIPDLMWKFFPNTLQGLAYKVGGLAKQGRETDATSNLQHGLKYYRAFIKSWPDQIRAIQDPAIDTPTLVLCGKDDPFIQYPTADELKPFFNRATCRIIKGKHWLQRTHPETVNQVLTGFIGDKSYVQ